jgi:hypothetical protein
MNFVLLYALLFVLIPLVVYFIFAFVIIFHIKKYGMDTNINKWTILIFCLGMAAISLMIIEKFAAVDWDRIDIAGIIRDSDINLFHIEYGNR